MRLLAFSLIVLMSLSPVIGQESGPAGTEGDRAQIASAAKAFVEAFNHHDADAVTSLFSEDAEIVEREGTRFVGREEIAAAIAATFQQNPKSKISLSVNSLRFLTEDAAIEEGSTVWFPDGKSATVQSSYRVAHVKRAGKWLMAGSRSIDHEVLSPYEHLRELEWMIGDWIDESSESAVVSKVRWAANRAFLIQDFTIHAEGDRVMEGSQRIGWDGQKQQFRSWTFDSEGGFVQGEWTSVDNGYVIRSKGVLRDGTSVSGTTRFDPIHSDRFSWSMFNRLRGDQILSDVDITIVRRPAIESPIDCWT